MCVQERQSRKQNGIHVHFSRRRTTPERAAGGGSAATTGRAGTTVGGDTDAAPTAPTLKSRDRVTRVTGSRGCFTNRFPEDGAATGATRGGGAGRVAHASPPPPPSALVPPPPLRPLATAIQVPRGFTLTLPAPSDGLSAEGCADHSGFTSGTCPPGGGLDTGTGGATALTGARAADTAALGGAGVVRPTAGVPAGTGTAVGVGGGVA